MKKLENFKKKIEKILDCRSGLKLRDLRKISCDFKKFEGKTAFISKKLAIVIKRQYQIGNYRQHKFFVPSVFIGDWTIQPLCQTKNRDKAYVIIQKTCKLRDGIDMDLSLSNVGFYRNRPVMFDW